DQLVEGVGPFVDLLLEHLEHLDLREGRDAVAAIAAATSAAATAALALVAVGPLHPVGLERVDELLEAAGGGPLGEEGGLVGLGLGQLRGGIVHRGGGSLEGEAEAGRPLPEPLDQLAGLVLEAGLDPAQVTDASPLGDRELTPILGAGLLVGGRLTDHLILPL